MHDSLGQTLSLAYLKLSAIDFQEFQSGTRKRIVEIFSLLNKAINESRDLTYDLSPPILYALGLIAAFKWRLDQIEQLHNIRTQLINGKIVLNIRDEITIFIYRIVNELLQNALKHALATEIILEISQKNNKYFITIRDNGVGFNKEKQNNGEKLGGFGLLSIKERLESFKGRLYLRSGPDTGTSASIEIPVNYN